MPSAPLATRFRNLLALPSCHYDGVYGRAVRDVIARDTPQAIALEVPACLMPELEWAASCLVGPEDYPRAAEKAGREGPYDPAVVAQVYEAYVDLKSAQGVADWGDLLLLTAGALEEHAGVAEEFRARYRSFVVDE